MWKLLFMLALLGFVFIPPRSYGQVSVNVLNFDPVYRDIDKLVAQGLVDRIIVGQRPYSRLQIATFIDQAQKNLHRLDSKEGQPSKEARKAYVKSILARLETEYAEELAQLREPNKEKRKFYSLRPIENATLDLTMIDSPPELLPVLGQGEIDAVINPFVDYRQGRRFVNGINLSLETSHWFRISEHFALYVLPRYQLAISRDEEPDDNWVYLMNLYGKFYAKNFEIEIGRDNLFWGQGQDAGLLLSNNPRGFDMIKISNDRPIFLPWVFKYMGPAKFSFFYSDLGPEQNFPHAYLSGYKISLEPFTIFEIGVALAIQGGGEGSPNASFWDRVADEFPIVTRAYVTGANKIAGFDFRIRIPQIRGTEFYGEAMYDDTPGLQKRTLWDTAAYLFGVYVPRLMDSGKADLRLEFHKTGITFYRHSQFTSGFTLNQFIIGDNLGPDAYGGYLNFNWDFRSHDTFLFTNAYEFRSSDQWSSISSPTGDLEGYEKILDLPDEQRYRFTLAWLRRLENFPLSFKVQAGYERVQNFQFTAGNDRNNFLLQGTLQWNLSKWSGSSR